MTSLLMEPTGQTKRVCPANGEQWTRGELQALVGGNLEVLRTIDNRLMVINDQGKVMTPPLDLNIPATRLYLHGRSDVVLGPAVIVDSLAELNS
jgi:hypothetical protein